MPRSSGSGWSHGRAADLLHRLFLPERPLIIYLLTPAAIVVRGGGGVQEPRSAAARRRIANTASSRRSAFRTGITALSSRSSEHHADREAPLPADSPGGDPASIRNRC